MTAIAAGSRLRGCIGESREKERDGGESNREESWAREEGEGKEMEGDKCIKE